MRKGRFGGRGRSREGAYNRRGGGRSGGGGGGGQRRRRYERASAHSGNERERIAIESGHLVFIDQFMLANPQFISHLGKIMDEDPSAKNELVRNYGGSVVELSPGTYRIERDPFAFSIIIHQDGQNPEPESLDKTTADNVGTIFVDTRCLAMVDRELLDDSGLLEKYQQLWFSGQDKACRDLLRDNGGAVRYGFQRYGDELGIYRVPNDNVVCLWPLKMPEPEQVQDQA